MSSLTSAPFPLSYALNKKPLASPSGVTTVSTQEQSETETIQHIPGSPGISLQTDDVHNHLLNELATPLLDELYARLWLVAKKSGLHIDALHVQKFKGRSIVPTEDPKFHLVWRRDKTFIKPMPLFLLNHDFWVRYLQPPKRFPLSEDPPAITQPTASVFDRSIAMGFMRSYALLVKYPLDLVIAKECFLIPPEVDWDQWSVFINHFRVVTDDSVAKRYHYGQLRLSRLDWAVRIFNPRKAHSRWFYEISYWSTSELIERVTFPLIFLFASVSLALSSMQVALAVPVDGLWSDNSDSSDIQGMNRAFWLFSIAVIILWLVIWVLLLGIPLFILIQQVLWGFRNRKEKWATHSSNI